MEWLAYMATILLGYFLGSIPTGYLVARAKGSDIRSLGSGNIGATNVYRTLGKGPGVLVFVGDALKGFAGGALAPWLALAGARWMGGLGTPSAEWLAILGGGSAILGHNYTCWLGFKGGKGVATTGGVLLALFPMAFLGGLVSWLVVLGLTRYVSLASLAAAVTLPFAVWFSKGSTTLIWVAASMGLLAIGKHRANIRRLLNGTEHRFGAKQPVEEKP